jgi:SPP1 family predicted phage head-tail adaptor
MTQVNDAIGSKTTVYTQMGRYWANVKYQNTGSDTGEQAGIQTNTEMITFTIRYNRYVSGGDRIEYKGEFYQIESISEVGRGKYHELKCRSTNV